jgi:D-alanyl-D-alanine carboxypeptidase
MNHEADRLGLTQTFFVNDTGLDVSSTMAGAYGSARDVAHLVTAVALEMPDVVERTPLPEATFVSNSGKRYVAKNTSLVGGGLTGAVATKTGYTDLAGGNMVALFEPVPGHRIALSVLGSTRDGRDADIRALADYAIRDIRRVILCQGTP